MFPTAESMTAVGRKTATRRSTTWKPSEPEGRNTCYCRLPRSSGLMIIKNFVNICRRTIRPSSAMRIRVSFSICANHQPHRLLVVKAFSENPTMEHCPQLATEHPGMPCAESLAEFGLHSAQNGSCQLLWSRSLREVYCTLEEQVLRD